MPRTRRRLLGAAIAAALLLAAGGGTALLRKARAQERQREVAEAVEASRARAQDALHAQLAVVEGRAASGASNPVLRAQLGVVDAATLKDGFASENWWDAVRREFPISGVAAGDAPEALVGLDPQALDFSGVIRGARRAGQAAALLSTPQGPPLVVGAAMADGRGGSSFAVLVAKPLDQAFVEQIASRTRGGALVSDGKRALLSAGPAEGQLNLKSAVGSEASGTFSGPGWAAAATALSPGLWLWTEAALRPLPPGPPLDLIVLWSLAGLGAIASLAFAFRKPAVIPTLPEMEAATLPSAGAVSEAARTLRSGTGQTGGTRGTSPGGRGTDSGANRRAVHPVARPNQFGRYYLIDRLGEGGMAEVYTAVAFGAESFRRAFVIKLLHSTAQRTEALVNMFIDEAKLASSLVHGNIIPVFDFGKVGDEYYMAQEYVLGRDLRRLVTAAMKKDGKPLDAKLSVYIVREGLRALEYAHTRLTDDGRPMGIVHRDVSPNNILVSARGEVKLLDFGIAKRDEGRLHQTQTGVVKGSVQYMAPEQARGEPVDARADVCSMGLVLYFLLTGRSLYRGDNAYNLLVQAAEGLNQEQIGALQAIPAPLAAILRVALEPDREQRFQDAAAFDNALSQAPAATGADLAREMQRLFGEELKAEQARFASVQPPEEPPPEEGTGEAGAM
jgi:hypothetical protein